MNKNDKLKLLEMVLFLINLCEFNNNAEVEDIYFIINIMCRAEDIFKNYDMLNKSKEYIDEIKKDVTEKRLPNLDKLTKKDTNMLYKWYIKYFETKKTNPEVWEEDKRLEECLKMN